MNFVRKRKRGSRTKNRKYWFSEEGYRITWRREVWGVQVPARYQASVRISLPNGEMWDHVSNQRLFKTLKAAEAACEKHQRLWYQVIEATGIRKLEELFGKVPIGYPVWTKGKLNRNIYALLTDTSTRKRKDLELCDQDDPTETSSTSAPAPAATMPISIPASPAAELVAVSATGQAKARRKSASKPTTKSSRGTRKKKQSTKDSSNSENKPLPNSRKKKGKL